jgi:TPR repeat protein
MKKIVLSLACAISFSFATAPEEKLQEQKDKEIERVIKTYDELASKYYELNPSILAFKHLYAIDDKELTVEDMLIIGNKYYFKDNYTDYQKALGWYKKVAEESYEVDYVIADMYRMGYGVRNEIEAFNWYEKHNGRQLLNNKHFLNILNTVLAWWEDNPNHPSYAFNTGYIYYQGGNFKEALELFEKAAAEKDPYAQYYLGVMYINGEGVDKNDKKAKEYFKKSCDYKLLKSCNALKELK